MLAGDLARDLRYALRTLRRSPGFVAVAVLSLGLGLGLTTTMFGLLDAVRHPYAPFARADALFSVRMRYYVKDVRITPFDMYKNVRDNTDVFDAVMPTSAHAELISGTEGTTRVIAARVPPRFFDVLGVRAEVGRVFTTADEAEDVAVVSHALWKRLLRGARSLSGQHITLGERTYAVIGVMPRGMTYPYGAVAWLPMSAALERTGIDPTMGFVTPLVRLKAGVTREAGGAQLAVLAHRLDAIYAQQHNPFAFTLNPVRDDPLELRDIHFAMLGGSMFVLLIACANLANLMLARGLNARRDVALRLAIGASRTAVVRQMFVESAVVTMAGAAVGAVLSVWGADILASRIPRELEWVGILEPQLSWRTFALAALATAASAVIFGLLPAVRVVSSVNLDEPLKEGSGNTTTRVRHRYSSLVMVEVALALALMMGAGLLTKVVRRLVGMEYSFPARLLVHSWAYRADTAAAAGSRLETALLSQVRNVAGVVDAATVRTGSNRGGAITAELSSDSVRRFNTMGYPIVSPSYLHAMGIGIVEGRDFEEGDRAGAPVAILNQGAARLLYPHGSAVGRMVQLGAEHSGAQWVNVVGVARGGAMRRQFTNEWVDDPKIWVVQTQQARVPWGVEMIVRSEHEDLQLPVRLDGAIRSAGWRSAGGSEPYLAAELSEIRTRGFLARLFATMATFALGLAAVGLYGVLAYAVTRRMREFGVRVAVGAQQRDILRLIAHDSTVMVLAGTAVGGFLALGTSFILEEYLIGVYPTDAWTLVISELVLFVAATIASLNPALRAMRANPLEILRAI